MNSTTENKRVHHLIVDSSAFIRQAPLHVSETVASFILNFNTCLFDFSASNRYRLHCWRCCERNSWSNDTRITQHYPIHIEIQRTDCRSNSIWWAFFELTFFSKCFSSVTNYSKKTGDYASLSAVDLRLLALTYQLYEENVGTDKLNLEPKINVIDHHAL